MQAHTSLGASARRTASRFRVLVESVRAICRLTGKRGDPGFARDITYCTKLKVVSLNARISVQAVELENTS